MNTGKRSFFSRNPVLWLVLAIPALTIVAGVWTLVVASGNSAVDADPDPVRRTAQVQTASIEADAEALRRKLSATLVIEDDTALLRLDQATGPRAPVLQLVHPLESSFDRQLGLLPDPRGWRTDGEVAATHVWQLRLVADDGSWRLVGRYHPGDTEVALAPALAAP
ncbi:MAG: nitrogen fixation protein FixH [Arenimonas sp.]|nr:nitrogen fixation protein FixH [Arenimonas sp.]